MTPAKVVLAAAVMLAAPIAAQAQVDEAAYAGVFANPPKNLPETCRNGAVEHAIKRWRQGGLPETGGQAFAGVDAIAREVSPPALERLRAQGCSDRFFWGLVACSQPPEEPGLDAEVIVPRGVTASNDTEMAALMQACLQHIKRAGVKPVE